MTGAGGSRSLDVEVERGKVDVLGDRPLGDETVFLLEPVPQFRLEVGPDLRGGAAVVHRDGTRFDRRTELLDRIEIVAQVEFAGIVAHTPDPAAAPRKLYRPLVKPVAEFMWSEFEGLRTVVR